MRLSGLVLAVLSLVGCHKPIAIVAEDAGPTRVAAPAAKAAPEPTIADFVAQMGAVTTYAEAIAVTRPMMSDAVDETSDGAKILAVWASTHALWKDVAPGIDETSYARVMKDVESERTKRLCIPGQIIQIAVDRSAGAPIAVGLIRSDAGNLFRFAGVGSSGDILEDSYARICGTVTGQYTYHNSGGGVGHAVQVVGMFDLAANRGRKLLQPMAGMTAAKP